MLSKLNEPFGLKISDLWLQSLSQASEYFMARDLFRVLDSFKHDKDFSETLMEYKRVNFTQS